MKKILIISFTDLLSDPRVNRQIKFLKDKYDITAVGTKDPQISKVNFIDCGRSIRNRNEKIKSLINLISGNFEDYYWSANHVKTCLDRLSEIKADIIIANDIDSLPLALKVSKGAKVIFDAHEYAPREFEDVLLWRILYQRYKKYLCSKYIKQADAMLTVCSGIADEYRKEYGVTPLIITNAPSYVDLHPVRTDNNKVRMIFHGAANPSRKIENMIKMMDYLDNRFYLDFMLTGSSGYISKLKSLASGNKHINFRLPVQMREICSTISEYDVGLYLLEPNSFNNRMALPNKFFEFIQARLAVAIGPSPEMARIVRENDCGVVSEDFTPQSLARALNGLTSEKIDYYKSQSDKLAGNLCAENNKRIIVDLVESL